jgi:hypothetical protein
MKMNIFIGIKTSGNFQHSSCKLPLMQKKRGLTIVLAGGKVTSAGIIVVKNGIVKSLSPLSGHYRSSIDVSAPPESAFPPFIPSSTACYSSLWRGIRLTDSITGLSSVNWSRKGLIFRMSRSQKASS